MSMSMPGDGDDSVMSEINTTPLVDIMLVLLIIFLITIPAVLQSVEVQLPDLAFEPTVTKPENVLLTIRANPADRTTCEVYLGTSPIDSSQLLIEGRKRLDRLIANLGGAENITEENMPEVHIRGDINTPYKCIGGVIYTMQYAGFQKIGFISEPAPGSATLQRL